MTGTEREPCAHADLDAAHVAWSKHPILDRPSFGIFAVNYLRSHGLELRRGDEPPLTARDDAASLYLPDRPYSLQAVAMGVEDVADLLAALAERGLRWIPGEHGECGTLLEGPPEPDDLHVVFDAVRAAWQRDDDKARLGGCDPSRRWFDSYGHRRSWPELQRDVGPLTPDGGIAPTTPQDEP